MIKFTQEENEAVIRLLLAGRGQDGVVSLSEGDEFKKQIAGLPWASETEVNFFVVTEAARIRKTLATQREEFIEAQCACFQSNAARASALDMLKKVLAADGLDPKESTFVAAVQKVMNR